MLKLAKLLFPSLEEVTHDELLLLFKNYYTADEGFVRSSIYWMVNSSDVDDLVQETFLRAWKSFRKFDNKSSFRTWIYRIAMNVTYDYFKKNKVHLEGFNEEYVGKENPEIELSDLISKGLMTLSLEQREAFSLHYQLGLKYLEISELLQIPVGTAKSRVSSAKKIFVDFLNENGVENER